MIFTLFFACIIPNTEKDLVGDSDRPLDPSIESFETLPSEDSAGAEPDPDETVPEITSYIYAEVDGDDILVEHYQIHLPCDFETSEASMTADVDTFLVEIIYTEREPDDCYQDLSYILDFENAPPGTYQLRAHDDETTFLFP